MVVVSTEEATRSVIDRFGAAFNARDLEAVMAMTTPDVVFDATGPSPDGTRFTGRDEVRRAWAELFASTREPVFDTEELVVAGDRAVVRWRYSWMERGGGSGHIRGIDLYRIRDGLVAEKLSYVKG